MAGLKINLFAMPNIQILTAMKFTYSLKLRDDGISLGPGEMKAVETSTSQECFFFPSLRLIDLKADAEGHLRTI